MLSFLWGGVRAAVCLSATLYLPKQGVPSVDYHADILGLPKGRIKPYPPVSSAWLYETVSALRLPDRYLTDTRTRWLRPPSRADHLNESQSSIELARWLNDVAQEILRIHQSAAGGVLVLLTAYSHCEQLSEQLDALPLVVARDSLSLQQQREVFLHLREKGEKAVWLALGNAWTGLDIGGHEPWAELFGAPLPAAEDNVLTDLVVARLPFGVNRSITHRYRMETQPMRQWDLLDACLRLRQGVGRLVRREGLPHNRRIHLLDSRMVDPSFGNYSALLLKSLMSYEKQMVRFSPP